MFNRVLKYPLFFQGGYFSRGRFMEFIDKGWFLDDRAG